MSNATDTSNLASLVTEYDKVMEDQEDSMMEINKIHKKLVSCPAMAEKLRDELLGNLRGLYIKLKELSETELTMLLIFSDKLDSAILHSLHQSKENGDRTNKDKSKRLRSSLTKAIVLDGSEQRKKRMKADDNISRLHLAGSVHSQLELAACLKDEQVAANVTPDGAEEDVWIVVKVINFEREAKEFEVLDEEPGDDEEGGGQSRKYKLHMSRIIPFPNPLDPSSAPDFPTGRQVLAVYPETTALYEATVANAHRKKRTDDYLLEFKDDEENGSLPQRKVPFHKVVELPEGHRQ